MTATTPSLAKHDVGHARPIRTIKDVPQILDLLENVFGPRYDLSGRRISHRRLDLMHSPTQLLRHSTSANRLAPAYVWEQDGRIVGNISILRTRTSGRYLLANVAVHPDYRRQGIAHNLLAEVLSQLQRHNAKTLLLQVNEDNTAAQTLYKAHGFTHQGVGSMWIVHPLRVRPLLPTPTDATGAMRIRPLKNEEWRLAQHIDALSMPSDLSWPNGLMANAYKNDWRQKLNNFINGRKHETWVADKRGVGIVGLLSIEQEWNQAHLIKLRPHPMHRHEAAQALLTKLSHRIRDLPNKRAVLHHTAQDDFVNALLTRMNLECRHTLAVMRRDF